MTESITHNGHAAENLCLWCGLCCNGVIFADVKLLPGEDAAELLSLGMPLSRTRCGKGGKASQGGATGGWRFAQPCAAFDGCHCRIYSSRPKHCRDFDCLLLKKVKAAKVPQPDALKVIRGARQRVDKVRDLLHALGDHEETLALSERFRRMSKRFRKAESDSKLIELYGRLTLAYHELSVVLQSSFFPGQ